MSMNAGSAGSSVQGGGVGTPLETPLENLELNSEEGLEGLEIRERWHDALEYCQKMLGRDYDIVKSIQSPEEMLELIEKYRREASAAANSVPRILRQFKPSINHLKDFLFGIAVGVGLDPLQTTCVWGLVSLILQLAVRSEDVLDEITSMWSEIASGLQIFDVYREYIEKDKSLTGVIFDVLVEVIMFAVTTVNALKYARPDSRKGMQQAVAWSTGMREKFRASSDKLTRRIHFIKEKVEAVKLAGKDDEQAELMRYLATQLESKTTFEDNPAGDVSLPCHLLPLPANSNFYGRDVILQRIEQQLHPDEISEVKSIRSVAMWAAAGLGKTQIALEYAHRQQRLGVQAILWISAEDEIEAFASFTEAAEALALPGRTDSRGHDQNRLAVQRWLQFAKTNWLIIFDNVEDQKLLKRFLPSSGQGAILITCRSEYLAASVASTVIEVPPFTKDEGADLLRRELHQESYTEQEFNASAELSGLLGGHALAIDLMARHMRSRKKRLEDFLQAYLRDPQNLHKEPRRGMKNLYYEQDIQSMWLIAFGQLEGPVEQVFGILCMLGPGLVPAKLFDAKSLLVPDLALSTDDYEEIAIELIDLALVRATESFRGLSVHRLIQVEYRRYLNPSERCKAWKQAVHVLRALFPQQHHGFALYNEWALCESLIEHVQAVARVYNEIMYLEELYDLEDFIFLCSDAARYLYEAGYYHASDELLQIGIDTCVPDSVVHTNLLVTRACILCDRGQEAASEEMEALILDTRRRIFPAGHGEIANALGNIAMSGVGTGNNLELQVERLKEALTINFANDPEERDKVLHLRHFNLCFAYKEMGMVDLAKEELKKATDCVEKEFGKTARYNNITFRVLADFEVLDGSYDAAYDHLEKALEIAKVENETNVWLSSSLYKMGYVRLLQDRAQEARDLLETALLISRINEREKGDQGETARILHTLSIALNKLGEEEKSQSMSAEAERIHAALVQTGSYTTSDDPIKKWDYLVCLKLR